MNCAEEIVNEKCADLSGYSQRGINTLDDWIVKEVVPQIMALEDGENAQEIEEKFDFNRAREIRERRHFEIELFCGKRLRTKEIAGVEMLQRICRDKNFELDIEFCDGSPFYESDIESCCSRRENAHYARITIYCYPLGSSEWKNVNEKWYGGGAQPRNTGFNVLCGILFVFTVGTVLTGAVESAMWIAETFFK